MSWLRFPLVGNKAKTLIWDVQTIEGVTLGRVQWFNSWRQYAFFPAIGVVFEKACLREIADFAERETKARRAVRKVERDAAKVRA